MRPRKPGVGEQMRPSGLLWGLNKLMDAQGWTCAHYRVSAQRTKALSWNTYSLQKQKRTRLEPARHPGPSPAGI